MSKNTVARLVGLFTDLSHENERGNGVYRMFCPAERYLVDFADDFNSEGWEQYDTDQDASYFGVWVNRTKFLTLTYAEGDWTLVRCPDAARYNAEIENANQFYGEGFILKAYGADGCTTVVQDRSRFLIPA